MRELRPKRGKGGAVPTLKPVAQIMASNSWWEEGEVTMPVGVMDVMGEGITVTFGSRRESRNPGPGVTRRQPGAKVGIMSRSKSGREESLAVMDEWKKAWEEIWSGWERRVVDWIVLPRSSKTLRNLRKS